MKRILPLKENARNNTQIAHSNRSSPDTPDFGACPLIIAVQNRTTASSLLHNQNEQTQTKPRCQTGKLCLHVAKTPLYSIVATIVILIINGCASITATDCLNADWRVAGYQDGAKGKKESRVEFYQQACNKFGVGVDTATYKKGYVDGIQEFCQSRNGYQFGLKGKEYMGVCPITLEAEFLPAYQYGKNIHGLKTKLKTAKRETVKNKKKLKKLAKALNKKQAKLDHDNSTQTPNEKLLKETAKLSNDQKTLEKKISQTEQIITALKRQIKTLTKKKWDEP
ncbi:MAG: DUF2799 domain-containing protein [Gammaproteobacteria bacterium]|nr:DUF2799 domain-containing protein [Gammaproteobacteria bacterium]